MDFVKYALLSDLTPSTRAETGVV